MKTLFCDLDNTLLFPLENGDYGIKPDDLAVLRRTLNKKVKLVISSGRPAEIKDSISKMIGTSVDAIGLNGQQIMTDTETFNLASFPKEDYLKITDWLELHYPETSTGTTDLEGIYYVNDLLKPQPLKRFQDHLKAGIVKGICPLCAKDAFETYGIDQVGKLLIYIDPETDSEPIIKELTNEFQDSYEFIRSNKMFIEGLCKGHSKKTGIMTYISMHHLDISECYCAGDADNDIDMFELLKENSFCMKNGTENAKKAAGHLVSSLSEAIEYICKNDRD